MRVSSAFPDGCNRLSLSQTACPYGEKEYTFFESFPAGVSRRKNPERICRKHEIPLLERRSQTARVASERSASSCYMGLAPVLVYDSLPFHHSGFHEYPPYPRIGRRPRALPLLRDDSSLAANRATNLWNTLK